MFYPHEIDQLTCKAPDPESTSATSIIKDLISVKELTVKELAYVSGLSEYSVRAALGQLGAKHYGNKQPHRWTLGDGTTSDRLPRKSTEEILELIRSAISDNPMTIDEISSTHNISRYAVWKHIKTLGAKQIGEVQPYQWVLHVAI